MDAEGRVGQGARGGRLAELVVQLAALARTDVLVVVVDGEALQKTKNVL